MTASWQPLLSALDPRLGHALGGDFGPRVGPDRVLAARGAENLDRATPFLVELGNMPFEQQAQILFFIADRLPRLYAMKLDAGGNGPISPRSRPSDTGSTWWRR